MTAETPTQSRLETRCLLCGSSRWTVRKAESRLLRMPPGTFIQTCTNCGLSVREPVLLEESTAATYDAGYYHEYQMVGREAPPQLVAALPVLERPTGPGRLLEIGCGLGRFLVRAKERGWDVQGVEASPWAAAQARLASQSPVVIAQAEALPFPSAVFDAVVSHHVFEHLADPIQGLRECHRICRSGGRLLLILPNELHHLFVRWAVPDQQGLPTGHGLLPNLRRWLAYQTAEGPCESSHLFFFHPQVLRQAAEAIGWDPLRLVTFRSQRNTTSGYPLGGLFKAALYALEVCLGRGPEMLLVAEAQKTAQ